VWATWQGSSAQQVVSCAVRWAAVSPLATDSCEHKLTLVGDAEGHPASLLMFGASHCGDATTEVSSQLTGSLNVTINVVRNHMQLLRWYLSVCFWLACKILLVKMFLV